MIRIDSIWLATEPMDMRAGTETALARVVEVFGAAKPHCVSTLSMDAHNAANTRSFVVKAKPQPKWCRYAWIG